MSECMCNYHKARLQAHADELDAKNAAIAKLREALEEIKNHQEIIGGNLARHGAVWAIANKALEATK